MAVLSFNCFVYILALLLVCLLWILAAWVFKTFVFLVSNFRARGVKVNWSFLLFIIFSNIMTKNPCFQCVVDMWT